MNTRHWTAAVSGLTLGLISLTVSGVDAGSWHYDEAFDTVVLDIPGSRDRYIRASAKQPAQHSAPDQASNWDYDEELDTIVLNFPGSRDRLVSRQQAAPSAAAVDENPGSWYYDEGLDTIVLNFPGSRE